MEPETRPVPSDYDRRSVTGSGPYQVEVAAGLRDVRFPPLCARCGGAPTTTLAVDKLFRRVYDDAPTRHVYARIAMPCCEACALLHEAERRPPDPALLRRLRNQWLVRTLPYWIPIAVILWLLAQLAPSFAGALAGGERTEVLLWGAVLAFFTLCLLLFVRLVLVARRGLLAGWSGDPNAQYVQHVRGPLGIQCVIPGPPTATLGAVDFTDEEFELFDRNRRTFTFTNHDVATAFAAANADLVWEPNSPRAVRARWGRNLVAGIVVVAGVVLWLRDVLGF